MSDVEEATASSNRKPRGTLVRPREDGDLFTINDVARHLRISTRSLNRLRADMQFPKPAILIGTHPRWTQEQVDAYLKLNRTHSH